MNLERSWYEAGGSPLAKLLILISSIDQRTSTIAATDFLIESRTTETLNLRREYERGRRYAFPIGTSSSRKDFQFYENADFIFRVEAINLRVKYQTSRCYSKIFDFYENADLSHRLYINTYRGEKKSWILEVLNVY